MNFQKNIEQIITDLEQNGYVTILKKDYRKNFDGDKEEIIEYFKEFGLSTNDSLLEFYSQVDLFELEWHIDIENKGLVPYSEDEKLVTGIISILPYHQMIEGKSSSHWEDIIWYEDEDVSLKNELKKLKPFDYFYSDNSNCVCCYLRNNKLEDRLMLFGNEKGINPFPLSLNEYIKALTITRGFHFWHDALLSKDNVNRDIYNHYMPQIFENYSLNDVLVY